MLYDEPLGESPLFILSLYTSFSRNSGIHKNILIYVMKKKNILLIHEVNLHSRGFEPYECGMLRAGFEPARLTPDDLKSSSLDHSDISARVF